jgi:hypothetical protein
MLIGLTGHASAGKDSAAAVLCAAGWKSIAWADALRIEVAAAWRIDERLLKDRQSKETPTRQLAAGGANNANWLRWVCVNGISLIEPRSPRWILQQWGSFRRQLDPLYWVRHVTYWVQYQRQHGHTHLVVTDTRYDNEATALRGLGGRIVRVHRTALAGLPTDTAQHESELHTRLQADADIHNDSTLAALGADVWRVVQLLTTAPDGATTPATGEATHG